MSEEEAFIPCRCPACGHIFKVPLSWFGARYYIGCPECHAELSLSPKQLDKIRALQKATTMLVSPITNWTHEMGEAVAPLRKL